jgi:hypothetical protein
VPGGGHGRAYAGLSAAVAALPALEELSLFGTELGALPPLVSSSLAQIGLGLMSLDDADAFDDEDMPDGWAEALARFVDQSRLPALDRLELAAYLRLDGLDPEEFVRRIAARSR